MKQPLTPTATLKESYQKLTALSSINLKRRNQTMSTCIPTHKTDTHPIKFRDDHNLIASNSGDNFYDDIINYEIKNNPKDEI